MKKRKAVIALVAVVALGLIAGSWAYFSQTSSIDNPFNTNKYGSTIVENFKPSDGQDWQPGVEVNKDVMAKNTGDGSILVRARLDETWTRSATATVDPGVIYKDSKNDPYDVYTTSQDDPLDGLTAADGSVVTKNFSTSTNWIDGGDGWYYYTVNVTGGQQTDSWLTSVQLLNDADMGLLETKTYVSASTGTDETTWVWFEYTGVMPKYIDAAGNAVAKDATGAMEVLHNKAETTYAKDANGDLLGYSQSDYTLTVTVQTVQPTQDALDAVFGGGSAFTPPAGTSWVLE